MKKRHYETICTIEKDTDAYEAQVILGATDTGLEAAAEAFAKDEISVERYFKVAKELYSANQNAWALLRDYVIEAAGEEVAESENLRINRISGTVTLQRELTKDEI